MFSRKRCVWALFSLQRDSPFNKAEISPPIMLPEDAANHTGSDLHWQNRKSGQWRRNILRMPDLAKPNVIVEMEGEDGYKGFLSVAANFFSPS